MVGPPPPRRFGVSPLRAAVGVVAMRSGHLPAAAPHPPPPPPPCKVAAAPGRFRARPPAAIIDAHRSLHAAQMTWIKGGGSRQAAGATRPPARTNRVGQRGSVGLATHGTLPSGSRPPPRPPPPPARGGGGAARAARAPRGPRCACPSRPFCPPCRFPHPAADVPPRSAPHARWSAAAAAATATPTGRGRASACTRRRLDAPPPCRQPARGRAHSRVRGGDVVRRPPSSPPLAAFR